MSGKKYHKKRKKHPKITYDNNKNTDTTEEENIEYDIESDDESDWLPLRPKLLCDSEPVYTSEVDYSLDEIIARHPERYNQYSRAQEALEELEEYLHNLETQIAYIVSQRQELEDAMRALGDIMGQTAQEA